MATPPTPPDAFFVQTFPRFAGEARGLLRAVLA
jgi:hypothetical protein